MPDVEFGIQSRREDTGEQALMPPPCRVAEPLERRPADAAFGCGHGADESRIVILVGQQAQIAGDILYFAAVEEGLPARDDIGNALGAQLLLDDACLMIAAIEDGVIGKSGAPLETMCGQTRDNPLRFVIAVTAGLHMDRVALPVLGPQFLFEQLGVVGDQGVGGLQDARGGAVVLLQLDHLQTRVIVAQ